MAEEQSNITQYESSVDNGSPIELYKFTQGDMDYLYTSVGSNISITISDDGKTRTEKYFADVISRAEIKPNTSSSGAMDMQITVWKDHPIAKLFQGAPPEKSVKVKIIRLHNDNLDKRDVVFIGIISQATFKNSDCTLTAKLENWLDKNIPRGLYKYFCKHSIYDHNCKLKKEEWQVEIFVDKIDGLTVYCDKLAEYEDGYFTGGSLYYDGQIRRVDVHKGNIVTLRYPFLRKPVNNAIITPGCNHLFPSCAKFFHNTLNFAGFPYVAPTNSEKNPVGKGAYWLDSQVVQRDTDGFVGTIEL